MVVIWYEVMNYVEYLEGSGQMMFRSFSYGKEMLSFRELQ